MSDTPRTHKASRLRGSLFFVETVVSESLERELNAANADLAQRTAERDALAEEVDRLRLQVEISDHCVAVLKAERDEARRDLCVSQAVDYLCETNPDEPISYDETRRIAAEFAAERGWDCFDAPHATDGRVQNGGA
jgi:hypothetical protein